MEKPTEIYRFGHYVNTVPDNKESLRQWIMDNCSYERCEGAIPPTMTLLECIKIARERGYTFTSKVTDSIEALREGVVRTIGKPVEVYKDGEFVGRYRTQAEAARELGLSVSKISRCSLGNQKTHKGFTFKTI